VNTPWKSLHECIAPPIRGSLQVNYQPPWQGWPTIDKKQSPSCTRHTDLLTSVSIETLPHKMKLGVLSSAGKISSNGCLELTQIFSAQLTCSDIQRSNSLLLRSKILQLCALIPLVRQWKHKCNKILMANKIKPRTNQTQQQSHNWHSDLRGNPIWENPRSNDNQYSYYSMEN